MNNYNKIKPNSNDNYEYMTSIDRCSDEDILEFILKTRFNGFLLLTMNEIF